MMVSRNHANLIAGPRGTVSTCGRSACHSLPVAGERFHRAITSAAAGKQRHTRRALPFVCAFLVVRALATAWWSAIASASLLLASEAESPSEQAVLVSPSPPIIANAERIPEKVRRYAQRLLRRYDANGDGKLQREEWRKMQGHPEAADANGDGVITPDELTNAVAAFGRNRHIGLAGPPSVENSPAPPDSPAAGERSRRDTTFYVPKSRLPPGLPEWFLRRDLDGDGQLSLSEFAPNPTQADLEEFARYDRNGDGFITSKECLDALKPAKPPSRKAAAASEKSAEKGGAKSGRKKNSP